MKNRFIPSGLLALALLAGCADKTETSPPAVRIVRAMTVGKETTAQVRGYGGDVRARHETLAGFRVGGKIAERLVEVGGKVKPGQPLARLDVTDLALRTREAEAQLALAAADAKRYRELRARNFVSQAAVEAHDTTRQAADAQAALARNQANYATLAAERAGVVAEVLAQPGQVVAAGQAVFRLAWDGEREVAISIPEDALADIEVGVEADIVLWSSPDKAYRGRLRELAPMADPATRTYAARVSLLESVVLPLGISATVNFKTSRVSALTVPLTGVFQHGDQAALWVIGRDNKLSLRPVRISAYRDEGALVTEGISVGERIVTAGVHRLHAGEVVRIAADAR